MLLTEEMITKRLKQVKGAQESVEAIATWILHHIKYVTSISRVWLDVYLTASDELKINLVYVLNDVCQKARKIEKDLFQKVTNSFYFYLRSAVPFSSPQVRTKIHRVVGILGDREVFSKRKVDEIKSLIDGNEQVIPKPLDYAGATIQPWMERVKTVQTQFDKYQSLIDKCLANEGTLKSEGRKNNQVNLTESHHKRIVNESAAVIKKSVEQNIVFDVCDADDESEEYDDDMKKAVEKMPLAKELDIFDADLEAFNAAIESANDIYTLGQNALQACAAVKAKEEGKNLTIYSKTTLDLEYTVSKSSNMVHVNEKFIDIPYNSWKNLKRQKISELRKKLNEDDKSTESHRAIKQAKIDEPLSSDATPQFSELFSIPVETIPLPPATTSHVEPTTSRIATYSPPSVVISARDQAALAAYASGQQPPSSRGYAVAVLQPYHHIPPIISNSATSLTNASYSHQTYDDVAPPGVDVPPKYDALPYSPPGGQHYASLPSNRAYPAVPTTSLPSSAPTPYLPPPVTERSSYSPTSSHTNYSRSSSSHSKGRHQRRRF